MNRLCNLIVSLTLMFLLLAVSFVHAGGISFSNSRIIYPLGSKQVSFSVSNMNNDTTYLIQSKVEALDGHKTLDFVVTPPIYTSGPKSENILRVIATVDTFPQDREKLYYFIVKAVPGISAKDQESSGMVIATETRLKLFVRPKKLAVSREKAIKLLRFKKTNDNGHLEIDNPTPYYFTLTNITIANKKISDVMIAPFEKEEVLLSGQLGDTVTYNSLNDYGGVDKALGKVE